MPGSPAHLVHRFFDVLTASALTETERSEVRGWLPGELADTFFAQGPADQRHGFEAARSVIDENGSASDMVVAALMHDVGKRHAALGLVGRSVASILILLRLPLTSRMRAYRDHGVLAARELSALGGPPLAIDFALHHHGERPATIEPETWGRLVAADRAKAVSRLRGRISSKST